MIEYIKKKNDGAKLCVLAEGAKTITLTPQNARATERNINFLLADIIGACCKIIMCMSNTSSSLPRQGVAVRTCKEGTVYLESEMLVFVSIIAHLSLIYLSACVFVHVPKIAFTTCVMISG